MTAQPSDFADCEQHWDVERQIAGCTRIVEDPTVPVSQRMWALTCRAIGYGKMVEYDRALDEFEIAIPLEPTNGYIYFLRAFLHLARHDPDRAISDLTEAIRLGSDSAMVFAKRAEAYRDFDSAIDDFAEVMARDTGPPDRSFAPFVHERGLCYHLKGDLDQAIADYSEAILLDPQDQFSLFNRSKAHRARCSTSTQRRSA